MSFLYSNTGASISFITVSRKRNGLERLFNRNVISSRYAERCFAKTLCQEPMMPRLHRGSRYTVCHDTERYRCHCLFIKLGIHLPAMFRA